MSYITCDGTTYSRYDHSKAAQDCIKYQDSINQMIEIACQKNPQCMKDREFSNQLWTGFAITIFSIFLILICIKIFKK